MVVVFLHGGGNRLIKVSNYLAGVRVWRGWPGRRAARVAPICVCMHRRTAPTIHAGTIPSAGSICSPPTRAGTYVSGRQICRGETSPPTRAGTYAPHVLRPSIAQEVSVAPPSRFPQSYTALHAFPAVLLLSLLHPPARGKTTVSMVDFACGDFAGIWYNLKA